VNLGNALELLGEREGGTEHLDKPSMSKTAPCRNSLRGEPRSTGLILRMVSQIALEKLGERTHGDDLLVQSTGSPTRCC
jgi:hypothetical protein